MTWKERRIVTILTTIVLILAAALLIVLGIRFREWRSDGDAGSGSVSTGTMTDTGAYTSLIYDNGTTTLSFAQNDAGTWTWTGDDTFPLDDTVIQQILDLLVNWDPQQTLTDEKALESSGLSEPTASLTAATDSGAASTVLFGRATTDGASYYARLNGDESTVYIIPGTLRQLMNTPIYDMCRLPELPQLSETDITEISLQGPAGEDGTAAPATLLAAASDGGEVSWRSNGANVTDDPTVRSLLEDVTALRIAKCVDYSPSEEAIAICGLDAPEAKLTLRFTSASGAEGQLDLAVGARLPDKSGRYVQVGDDTTIYLLETALLDPLMRVAATGLEG